MRNPFKRESKSYSVMPEWMWLQAIAKGDQGQLPVSPDTAVGLPALMAVIRLISHAAGIVPLNVMRGDEDSIRERARDTWQWNLLHRRPGPPPTTPFNFKADIAAQFCGAGNAYIRKIKPPGKPGPERPRVLELMPIDPGKVTPKRSDNGFVRFMDSTGDRPVERGTDEIIHIRSFSLSGGLEGVSPITAARTFVSAGLQRQQFEERHLANGIFPSVLATFPPGMTEEQGARWLDFLRQQNAGSAKAGKIVGTGGGATLSPFPVSLVDAMFAELTQLTLEQAAAMYQVPLSIATGQKRPVTDDEWRHFTSFALAPVFTAIGQSLEADDDLFSLDEGDLSVVADVDALLELDPLKKAQVQLTQVQSGVRLADEVRNEDGYGPLPPIPDDWTQRPGQVPQITPVGGAPNPTANTDAPAGAEEDDVSGH